MAGIFRRICTVCGKVDDFPHTRDDKPQLWIISKDNPQISNKEDIPYLKEYCINKEQRLKSQ